MSFRDPPPWPERPFLRNLATYRKPIRLEGRRPVAEVEAALARMTRPGRHSFRFRTGKPFVGAVVNSRWRLRYAPSMWVAQPLNFRLESTPAGTRLIGWLEVSPFVWWFSASYAIFAVVSTLAVAVTSTLVAQKVNWLYVLAQPLKGIAAALIFGYGYNGLAVFVGRRIERQGLVILQHVMNEEAAETIVRDILHPPPSFW